MAALIFCDESGTSRTSAERKPSAVFVHPADDEKRLRATADSFVIWPAKEGQKKRAVSMSGLMSGVSRR